MSLSILRGPLASPTDWPTKSDKRFGQEAAPQIALSKISVSPLGARA